jgi:hypothetical protein
MKARLRPSPPLFAAEAAGEFDCVVCAGTLAMMLISG